MKPKVSAVPDHAIDDLPQGSYITLQLGIVGGDLENLRLNNLSHGIFDTLTWSPIGVVISGDLNWNFTGALRDAFPDVFPPTPHNAFYTYGSLTAGLATGGGAGKSSTGLISPPKGVVLTEAPKVTSSSWGSPETLASHYQNHGVDFGATSSDDYATMAKEFFESRATAQVKVEESTGVIRVYDPASNTFGAYNPDGSIRTFFKPTSPTYFERQPGANQ